MEKDLLTIEEACEYLGVTRKTIYNYIERRLIKARRIVGTRRFYVSKSELEKLLVEVW